MENAGLVIMLIVLILGMFLIGRELMLWYWRITDIVKVLKEINRNLISMDSKLLDLLPKQEDKEEE